MKGWAEVSRLKRQLDSVFARMPASSEDIQLQADFARYLCILVSGFFENSIQALVLDFVQKRSSDEVSAYVAQQLKYWTNPNTEKIFGLLGAFSSDWRDKAELYLVDARKESVNSLVALRHKIAHGESVGTTLFYVKAYYATIVEVIGFIADLMKIERT